MKKKKDHKKVEESTQKTSEQDDAKKIAEMGAMLEETERQIAAGKRIVAQFDPDHPPVSFNRPCLVVCIGMGCPHIEKCWKPRPLPSV